MTDGVDWVCGFILKLRFVDRDFLEDWPFFAQGLQVQTLKPDAIPGKHGKSAQANGNREVVLRSGAKERRRMRRKSGGGEPNVLRTR